MTLLEGIKWLSISPMLDGSFLCIHSFLIVLYTGTSLVQSLNTFVISYCLYIHHLTYIVGCQGLAQLGGLVPVL